MAASTSSALRRRSLPSRRRQTDDRADTGRRLRARERLADCGAAAVIAPMIDDATTARRFAAHEVPAVGQRSWGRAPLRRSAVSSARLFARRQRHHSGDCDDRDSRGARLARRDPGDAGNRRRVRRPQRSVDRAPSRRRHRSDGAESIAPLARLLRAPPRTASSRACSATTAAAPRPPWRAVSRCARCRATSTDARRRARRARRGALRIPLAVAANEASVRRS